MNVVRNFFLPMLYKIKVAITFACVIAVVGLLGVIPRVYAVDISSIGIANYLEIHNDRVEDGSIVVASTNGYVLSTKPYDTKVIGVVSFNPAVSLRSDISKKTYPVVNFGTATVRVSGTSGNIRKGDSIATSSIQGVGMKAVKAGYVLGESLEDIKFAKASEIKQVQITMNLHFFQAGQTSTNSIFDLFSLTQIATYEQPLRVLQYIVAGLILISSFVFGFLIFGKTVSTGIEALGRNPLAGRMIQLSIIFNVVLIIVIIMAGITLSYILIRL